LKKEEYNIAVHAFSARLFRYVNRFVKNPDDSKDIVQDSYEKLWQNLSKVEFDCCKSWLFTTSHNGMVNFMKKHSRLDFYEDMPERDGQEDFGYENRQLVNACLEKLPAVQKSVLLLRDLEGYDYAEIGKILNLNESQVKVYLFRARLKIKNQLKDLTVLS
jgi:RNA polymerase sigma-70 factor (ECF subfamily)